MSCDQSERFSRPSLRIGPGHDTLASGDHAEHKMEVLVQQSRYAAKPVYPVWIKQAGDSCTCSSSWSQTWMARRMLDVQFDPSRETIRNFVQTLFFFVFETAEHGSRRTVSLMRREVQFPSFYTSSLMLSLPRRVLHSLFIRCFLKKKNL